MSDVWLLRTGILIAGILLVIAIYFFGRPRKGVQGRRVDKVARGEGDRDRMEPTLGAQIEGDLGGAPDDATVQSELDLLDSALGAGASAGSDLGRRDNENFDKIISLYVAARAGQQLQGPDIVVAAEKAGLTFGHMNVFHRLTEGHPERGPIFSVANIMKPGSFEMAEIQSLQTPAIAFFLTLPAPLSALEAWDTMLPTAQRMAELLDGVVLDQERNALGRQRIAHIRDDLRAYDRQHEAPPIKRSPRW
ncbi:cell division protein ZipA [Luteimonas cucumeris]|uniref:Cell division protein ZipA n=1 Tax=Luteimonas cucumeris TaxID=985012 RepID=A0A562L7W4_9GAMM|nr:cell division protein ZipA [Luteimonas cucumeris]TWI03711.1 cell division protein ZipA [Luteimonas cucumeris]